MEIRKIISVACLCLFVVVSSSGCNDSDGSSGTGDGKPIGSDAGGGSDAADGGSDAGGDTSKDPAPSTDGTDPVGASDGGDDGSDAGGIGVAGEDLELPPIYLSQQHRATCLVQQGDTMPEIELQDVAGQQQKLSDLYGDRLTVVCFWSGDAPSAIQQLQDMAPEIIDVFGDQGVKVATVNFRQSADDAKDVAESADAEVPILLDLDGTAFAKVATRYLPRTYLLDRDGKIIWFDLEYSSDTRRHLVQAIRYTLAQP